MSDLISRQAALDVIAETDITNGTEPVFTGKQVQALLQDLPTVTPKQRWIPVSERLPEDAQTVLFCDIDNDIMVGYHIKGRTNTHFVQDGTFEDMKNVRAWMPLPAPYEPQEIDDCNQFSQG